MSGRTHAKPGERLHTGVVVMKRASVERVEVECQTDEEEGGICTIWFPVCHFSAAF